MRIAIPVTDGLVAEHLGHCESFLVADVEGGAVTREQLVPNPGHGPGGPPPHFLARLGVTQVVAWGIPPHGHGLLVQMGVAVQLGVTGDAHAALRGFLDGTLTLTSEGLDAGGGCGHGDHEDHEH